MQRPANLRIVRVMCGGRIDPQFVINGLMNGADGVLVSHCHPGDCHYIEGNLKTVRKMPMLHLYLKQFGINPKRAKYIYVSASEGIKLTEVIKEYSEELYKMRVLNFDKVKNFTLLTKGFISKLNSILGVK